MRSNELRYLTLISYTNKISTKSDYNKGTNRVHNEKLTINNIEYNQSTNNKKIRTNRDQTQNKKLSTYRVQPD